MISETIQTFELSRSLLRLTCLYCFKLSFRFKLSCCFELSCRFKLRKLLYLFFCQHVRPCSVVRFVPNTIVSCFSGRMYLRLPDSCETYTKIPCSNFVIGAVSSLSSSFVFLLPLLLLLLCFSSLTCDLIIAMCMPPKHWSSNPLSFFAASFFAQIFFCLCSSNANLELNCTSHKLQTKRVCFCFAMQHLYPRFFLGNDPCFFSRHCCIVGHCQRSVVIDCCIN